jgi:hypothetical protein
MKKKLRSVSFSFFTHTTHWLPSSMDCGGEEWARVGEQLARMGEEVARVREEAARAREVAVADNAELRERLEVLEQDVHALALNV